MHLDAAPILGANAREEVQSPIGTAFADNRLSLALAEMR
jgi:hypothetical protein